MSNPRDYYEVLEVHPRARAEIIEKAYRVLALHYHPDVHPPERRVWAEEMMKEINAAYRTLRDPEKRIHYDMLLGLGRFSDSTGLEKTVKCFNHPKEPHVAICSQCQRPICAQCTIEIWERLLCLGCAAVMYAERHPEERPPSESPPSRASAMGWGGLAFYYLIWVLCLWGIGLLGYRLAGSPADPDRFFLILSLLSLLTVGILALCNQTTSGVCRECGTVNNNHAFRRRAPWAEFWQPSAVCRECGCAFAPGEVKNILRRLRYRQWPLFTLSSLVGKEDPCGKGYACGKLNQTEEKE